MLRIGNIRIPTNSQTVCGCFCASFWEPARFRRVSAPDLPASLLPLGTSAADSKTKLVAVDPGPTLVHRVLSISTAASAEEEDVVQTNVAGFIVV